MAFTIAPRSWTSLILRSFLVVPVVLLFSLPLYDVVLRWKLSTSLHRDSYTTIASKYVHSEPAKFEDDTWVDMIGHASVFISFLSSLFAGGHLFVLIFEASSDKVSHGPAPKEWYEMLFATLGWAIPPYAIAVHWTFFKRWHLEDGLQCTLNHKLHKMRCTPITTYCVLPKMYPDLLPKEDLARNCERAKTSAWLMVVNLISALVIIVPFIYLERSRVLKHRANLQLAEKPKALEAQDSDDKKHAEVTKAAVLGNLSEKNEPEPKKKLTKKEKAFYAVWIFSSSYSMISFVRRLFE
ncbi:hypothetical protein BDV96DRAFT_642802 [Lophiotrema nucula]|uniref:Uncharacterized protein n=1 Tax=Lophiotrema nucula TaxID=690887 RepID=A0A6A5ZLB2_9PLEO|nr:hypothetical protein BDV96DRAFT_642802 [Lophiotrema nucula]